MNKLDDAKAAIDALFGDTSVCPEKTLDALGELFEHLEMKIDALESQIYSEIIKSYPTVPRRNFSG